MAQPSPQIDRLAAELARLESEEVIEVFRKTLQIKSGRQGERVPPGDPARVSALMNFLEREIWPQIPASQLGRGISKQEREEILGYGPEGV